MTIKAIATKTIATKTRATKTLAIIAAGAVLSCGVNAGQICQRDNLIATAADERYSVGAQGAVTDKKTGLVWQRCLVGQSGGQCDAGSAQTFSWAAALLYPATANREGISGHSDWRLPNIRELATLAELQCARPAINLSVFPNTPPAPLWSSSPYRFYPHYSWYMDFEEGIFLYADRTDSDKYIRLVRDAAP